MRSSPQGGAACPAPGPLRPGRARAGRARARSALRNPAGLPNPQQPRQPITGRPLAGTVDVTARRALCGRGGRWGVPKVGWKDWPYGHQTAGDRPVSLPGCFCKLAQRGGSPACGRQAELPEETRQSLLRPGRDLADQILTGSGKRASPPCGDPARCPWLRDRRRRAGRRAGSPSVPPVRCPGHLGGPGPPGIGQDGEHPELPPGHRSRQGLRYCGVPRPLGRAWPPAGPLPSGAPAPGGSGAFLGTTPWRRIVLRNTCHRQEWSSSVLTWSICPGQAGNRAQAGGPVSGLAASRGCRRNMRGGTSRRLA